MAWINDNQCMWTYRVHLHITQICFLFSSRWSQWTLPTSIEIYRNADVSSGIIPKWPYFWIYTCFLLLCNCLSIWFYLSNYKCVSMKFLYVFIYVRGVRVSLYITYTDLLTTTIFDHWWLVYDITCIHIHRFFTHLVAGDSRKCSDVLGKWQM